ncbi:hypothetical protein BZL29_2571 [Mycobacterium kansasii]|uniref:Uncharacterized protein n=1 Tax=Mycobacterium kansasii TaxID=1768 RepID=A0A1V3XLE3_MYCKA|nr:hypothetical protein BZL29_2571 [Mycobacterium kansasii]
MSSRNGALQRMRAIVAATVRLLVGGTWSVPDWLTGRMRPVFHRRSRRPHHHIAHID